ncbi:hypothetical protein HDG70_001592 [Carboxydothermus ferrireducens DSM 11255]|uniref:Uncharacterized protein n=1 Tax=Carboxydothermus ferrireducens DSM 11255 TaxID=1119529 RepID=A0ABX2RB98_9THEO|nr:hypothetical protein [Carboxydothermus ferrireducens DSM 11255]
MVLGVRWLVVGGGKISTTNDRPLNTVIAVPTIKTKGGV